MVFFHAKVFPSHRTQRAHKPAIGGSRFVQKAQSKTLSELLVDDPKLLAYVPKLEAAELDGELAAELGLAEMRDVLPDAPIAHCLLLVRRLSELKTVQPAIPDTPAWKWPARVIATGVRDSNLKDQATVKHEFDLIGGSLLLSFAIGPLLSPQTTCADGSECPVILALDMLCWATLSTCLLLCVVSSWSMVAIEQCVSTEAMARWAYENWPFYNMGAGLMVTSFTFLPFALATRSVILLHGNPAYPAWLVWIVMAILLGGGIVMQYTWWIIICCRTFAVSSAADFVAFNLGLLGFRMPKTQLERAPVQMNVPYMD